MVIDSPRIGSTAKEQRAFATRTGDSDLVIWALDAHREDARIDLAAITAIRTHFVERPHRRRPPIIVALTHIEQLTRRVSRPDGGIDLGDPAIVEAVREVADGLGVPKNDVVPVSLMSGRAPFNIEQLSLRIAARVPEARQAQLLRLMEDAAPRWSVRRVLGQAGSAAMSAARSVAPSIFKS